MVDAGQLTTDGTGRYYAPLPDVNPPATPSTVPAVPDHDHGDEGSTR
jgi:hypothetical protein